MPQVYDSPAEIARIGEEKYHREIRDKVLPQHQGKFPTLDIV